GPAGPMLGTRRDSEAAANASADGLGDDRAGVDDEDGVTFAPLTPGQMSSATVTVTAPAGAPISAFLDAWIDFNGDGDFLDAGERLTPGAGLAVTVGSNQVSFPVPVAGYSGQTFARFRLSTFGGLGPTGLTVNGEVEDYAVRLLPSAIVYVN